jgi:uncharacterized damage-inducible protein DinB
MPATTANPLAHHFLTMAYNNAWANFRLAKACAQLSQDDFIAPRTSFFPTIKATLNHLLIVDWVYVEALEREGRGAEPHPDSTVFLADREPCATAAAWSVEQARVDARLIAYCKTLHDADMEHAITILRPAGALHETRTRLLAHVFQHQIHHRGQVHAMLSGTPVAPPQLDDFFRLADANDRAADFAELGWSEDAIWGRP